MVVLNAQYHVYAAYVYIKVNELTSGPWIILFSFVAIWLLVQHIKIKN
jgi:hypothetical protein